MTSYLEKQAAGLGGYRIETGTTAVTGDFCEIHMIEATVFTLLTNTLNDTASDAITGVSFPAGFVLKGKFTAFTLASGKVVAYKSPKVS